MVTGGTQGKGGVKVVVLLNAFPVHLPFTRATHPDQRIWLQVFINSCKLLSHFRCSCPERYRFACSLKNVNLPPAPIYSWKNYWGSVKGAVLDFGFCSP